MPTLNSRQLTELADSFLAFADAVGNYRMENKRRLSPTENEELKELHYQLCNYADDLYTASTLLVMNEIENSLDTIKDITSQIGETYKKLQKVQKAINVAAAGVTLGSAIFSKDPQAIASAVKGLVHNVKDDVG